MTLRPVAHLEAEINPRAAFAAQPVHRLQHIIAGNGEAVAFGGRILVWAEQLARHQSDDVAFQIHERAAAVAGIDDACRLKIGRQRVAHAALAVTDDSVRHRLAQIERTTHGQHEMPALHFVRITESQRRELLAAPPRLYAQQRDVYLIVLVHQRRMTRTLFAAQRHKNPVRRALHHMPVGHDVPLFGNDRPRADARLRDLPLHVHHAARLEHRFQHRATALHLDADHARHHALHRERLLLTERRGERHLPEVHARTHFRRECFRHLLRRAVLKFQQPQRARTGRKGRRRDGEFLPALDHRARVWRRECGMQAGSGKLPHPHRPDPAKGIATVFPPRGYQTCPWEANAGP